MGKRSSEKSYWKSESVTDQLTDQPTMTGVGSRDTCVSSHELLIFLTMPHNAMPQEFSQIAPKPWGDQIWWQSCRQIWRLPNFSQNLVKNLLPNTTVLPYPTFKVFRAKLLPDTHWLITFYGCNWATVIYEVLRVTAHFPLILVGRLFVINFF